VAKWEKANFSSLDQAHEAAKILGMDPTEITQHPDKPLRYFKTRDGMLIAQPEEGEVLQRQVAKVRKVVPKQRPRKRMIAGEWHQSRFESIEAYEEHLRGLPGKYEYTKEEMILFTHPKGHEDEFRWTEEGLMSRHLFVPLYPLHQ